MNSTYRLCDAIFGSRGSRLEVDMNAAGKRERSGMKRYEMVLDNARRHGSITAKQKKAITEIFSATIAGRIGSLWSTGVASSIDKYTRNSEKPIVAELRVQGGAGRRRKIYSGRIYFDCKDESSLEYLSQVVFEGTDLIKKSGLQCQPTSTLAVQARHREHASEKVQTCCPGVFSKMNLYDPKMNLCGRYRQAKMPSTLTSGE